MRHFLVLVLFTILCSDLRSQDVSLLHSGTLYNSLENPVESSFTNEYSRKYASNLFFPSFNGTFRLKGQIETAVKDIVYNNKAETSFFINSEDGFNKLDVNINSYLLQFKIFQTVNYKREIGFGIQFRNEGFSNINNKSIAFLNKRSDFGQGNYTNLFNNQLENQSFWQYSVTYRENYNDRLAFGVKLSLLSGAAYSKGIVSSSNLNVEGVNYNVGLNGNYISSFGLEKPELNTFKPTLRNLGSAITLGTSYILKNGMYVTGHLKDLGFIRWNDNTDHYLFNENFLIDYLDRESPNKTLYNNLTEVLNENTHKAKSTSYLYPKVEIAISKVYDQYHPVLAFNKYITRDEWKLAFLNNFNYRRLNFGINAIYESVTGLNFGTLFMVKSYNTEFYIGTEKLFSLYYLAKGYSNKDAQIGKSPTQMNAFFGLNIKFGKEMQSPSNADFIGGLNDKETGYISRMHKKDKRATKVKRR
jgi:hypothetical protein